MHTDAHCFCGFCFDVVIVWAQAQHARFTSKLKTSGPVLMIVKSCESFMTQTEVQNGVRIKVSHLRIRGWEINCVNETPHKDKNPNCVCVCTCLFPLGLFNWPDWLGQFECSTYFDNPQYGEFQSSPWTLDHVWKTSDYRRYFLFEVAKEVWHPPTP